MYLGDCSFTLPPVIVLIIRTASNTYCHILKSARSLGIKGIKVTSDTSTQPASPAVSLEPLLPPPREDVLVVVWQPEV